MWPPAEVQALQNLKSNYLLQAKEKGIPIAPTTVQAKSDADPVEISAKVLAVAKARGWEKIVIKPVPGAWSRGIKRFDALALHEDSRYKQLLAHGMHNEVCKKCFPPSCYFLQLGRLSNTLEAQLSLTRWRFLFRNT